MQTTLAKSFKLSGHGVHSGAPATVVVRPAPAGAGLRFMRSDLRGDNWISARFDNVVDTRLCTVIANRAGAAVGTIEHLVAALAGCGVDNAVVEIDGPETPIMDGSAEPFVQAIRRAGVHRLDAPLLAYRIIAPVSVERDGKRASLSPCSRFEIGFEIEFEDRAIGRQSVDTPMNGAAFCDSFSDCRTFARRQDVEMLRLAGLARGGSLENAVVVEGARVLNPAGLRRPDEFVRHKALDAVGDLALFGAPIIGRYEGFKAGHEMTNLLLRELAARSGAWRLEVVANREAMLPSLAPALASELAFAS